MSSNMTLEKIKRDLIEAVTQTAQPKTSPYDTDAVVKRVEGDTAYVHITGGISETPVNLTIDAKKGDKVKVRVSGGSAWIVGNQSAPPTDDTRAKVAEHKAVAAESKANEAKAESAEAIVQSTEANANASEAIIKANGSVASDTLHYLATSASSGVTINTQGWTTTVQTIDSQKRYLWTYHTYTKANGSIVNTQPVITGTYGVDGTSATILGSYNTLAELQAAHPTGQLGDAYMVAGDLYVWNGTAWENVGQIQGPKGDTGTSVTQVINYYLATPANSGITRETTGWTTTIQTMTATNQYLWNYEVVKGTGNVTLNTTDPIIIGRYGQNGQNGISVSAVQPQYYLSTSASSATGGSWGTTLVYQSGKYIWTRDAITYSNGNIGYSTAIYNSALTSACVNALNALQIAEDTNQYFWHTETGTDTGAHITEIPQEDFVADPQNGGGNLLARSNGIAVRDGLTELAMFGASKTQIGQNANGKSRTEIGSDGMQIMQKNSSGNDVQIANLGYGDSTDSTGSMTTSPYYTLGRRLSTATAYSSSATYNYGDICEHEGEIYVCKYAISTPEAWNANHWAYSIGSYSVAENRDNVASASESHAEGVYTKAIGLRSHAEGMNTVAIGSESHAEGRYTEARGGTSHAEGNYSVARGEASHASGSHTIANAENQTVIGKYNIPLGDPTVVNTGVPFIIGNGSSDNNRSNALTVDWDGKIQTPQMQAGNIGATSVSANSYTDVAVTFSKAMSGTPIVVCCVVSTSTAGAIGSITATVTSTSTTGFTCRIFNAGSTARTPAVNWIAMNI